MPEHANPTNTAIGTPYPAQIRKHRRALNLAGKKHLDLNHPQIRIGTAEHWQGKEPAWSGLVSESFLDRTTTEDIPAANIGVTLSTVEAQARRVCGLLGWRLLWRLFARPKRSDLSTMGRWQRAQCLGVLVDLSG